MNTCHSLPASVKIYVEKESNLCRISFASKSIIKRKVKGTEWLNEARERCDNLQEISRSSERDRKISSLSLLQVGRWLCSYLSSLRIISSGGGASSLVGFQAQITNRITESPASEQSQLMGPIVDVEL